MEFKNFSDLKVEKPDLNAIRSEGEKLCARLKNASDANEAIGTILDEFRLDDEVSSNYTIVSIRNSCDIRDPYYKDLMDYYDENLPSIQKIFNAFEKEVYASKYRKEIEERFGKQYITKIEMSLKTFKPEIMGDLVEENKLVSEYNSLMGQAKGVYKGEEIPITKFDALMDSPNREVRKEASAAYWGFFEKNEEKLASIYSRLVEVRTRMAKKLGFENYLPLGYLRMGRSDYGPEEVRQYRKKVLEEIVPLDNGLYADQMKRIGISDPKYYDYRYKFLSGNPKPHGTPEELVEAAKKMYAEMNPVASKYFDFMADHGLMDLVARDGKIPGGYMTYIPSIRSSFIFSNFNGSDGDVDVLTHEFGHSLQGFLSADIEVPSLRSPGAECCEIHSMSMEFLTYPYMELFFKEDADKYRYQHLADGLEFIPYGVTVDAFQDFVYTHPEATHEERKAEWRRLEKLFTPHKKFGEDNPFLESGGWWMRQLHIFVDPLYYIDYTIAQIGAFEFFVSSLTDPKATFEKYLNYDRLGGKYPYKELLKKAGISDPMEEKTIPELIPHLTAYLARFDTEKL